MIPGNLTMAWSLEDSWVPQHRTWTAQEDQSRAGGIADEGHAPGHFTYFSHLDFRAQSSDGKTTGEKPQGVGEPPKRQRQTPTGRRGHLKWDGVGIFQIKNPHSTCCNLTVCPLHPRVKVFVADGKEQNDPKMSILFSYNKEKLVKIHKTVGRKSNKKTVRALPFQT